MKRYKNCKMNQREHVGDCSIYASLINEFPEAGICTCGYGLNCFRKNGYFSELYSDELISRLKKKRELINSCELDKLIEKFGE